MSTDISLAHQEEPSFLSNFTISSAGRSVTLTKEGQGIINRVNSAFKWGLKAIWEWKGAEVSVAEQGKAHQVHWIPKTAFLEMGRAAWGADFHANFQTEAAKIQATKEMMDIIIATAKRTAKMHVPLHVDKQLILHKVLQTLPKTRKIAVSPTDSALQELGTKLVGRARDRFNDAIHSWNADRQLHSHRVTKENLSNLRLKIIHYLSQILHLDALSPAELSSTIDVLTHSIESLDPKNKVEALTTLSSKIEPIQNKELKTKLALFIQENSKHIPVEDKKRIYALLCTHYLSIPTRITDMETAILRMQHTVSQKAKKDTFFSEACTELGLEQHMQALDAEKEAYKNELDRIKTDLIALPPSQLSYDATTASINEITDTFQQALQKKGNALITQIQELEHQKKAAFLRDVQILGLPFPSVLLPEELTNREEFLRQILLESPYTILPPTASPPHTQTQVEIAQLYNTQAKEALVRDSRLLGLKLPTIPEGIRPEEKIFTQEQYLELLAMRNGYALIPDTHASLQEHPELATLANMYNAIAQKRRDAWLLQYPTLRKIEQTTKRGFVKIQPFKLLKALQPGAQKAPLKVRLYKPSETDDNRSIEKIKVLGLPRTQLKKIEEHLTEEQVQQLTQKKTREQADILTECSTSEFIHTKTTPEMTERASSIISLTKVHVLSHTMKTILDIGAKMEYCDLGTLTDAIEINPSVFSPYDKMRLASEILKGLSFMHDTKHLCHSDVKPDNIFVTVGADGQPHALLADLGMTAISNSKREYFKGTFVSPEQYLFAKEGGPQPVLPSSDTYAVCGIVAQLKYGKNPLIEHDLAAVALDGFRELVTEGTLEPETDKAIQERFKQVADEMQAKATDPSADAVDRSLAQGLSNDPTTPRQTAAELLDVVNEWLKAHEDPTDPTHTISA